MKTHLLKVIITLLFFAGGKVWAQQWYDIEVSKQTYQNLSGATSITGNSFFDTLVINANFLSPVNDTLLLCRSGGNITFPGNNKPFFYFYGAELMGGQWSYLIDSTGITPILKIEGKNVGFGHDFSQSDYVNFQLWLPSHNNAEVHFGMRRITDPDFDFYFGLGGPTIGYQGYRLSGNASWPVMSYTDTARIIGSPVSGTVYKFRYMRESVQEINQPNIVLYPNPAGNFFEVTTEFLPKAISVTDINGKTMFTNASAPLSNSLKIETGDWPTGVYMLKVETAEGAFWGKVCVRH